MSRSKKPSNPPAKAETALRGELGGKKTSKPRGTTGKSGAQAESAAVERAFAALVEEVSGVMDIDTNARQAARGMAPGYGAEADTGVGHAFADEDMHDEDEGHEADFAAEDPSALAEEGDDALHARRFDPDEVPGGGALTLSRAGSASQAIPPESAPFREAVLHAAEDVEFVVLIPVYRHSVLLVEAIESVLRQTIARPLVTVIVNDGCPHVETDYLCRMLSQGRPDVVYLRQQNQGPSAARNFGLDFVTANYPNLKALFYLDADNRLSPHALEAGWALLTAHPEVSWIYPHITTFEVEWFGDYNIPYSRLLHVVHENLCDTGCLLRADVAKSLRFNASARSGFEDWDYWLSAIAAGHRGMCADLFGFEYRNRAESRFKDVSRDRGAVTNYLRDRYKKIFTARKLLSYEHEEAPRFQFVDMETLGFNYLTDPARPWKRVNVQTFYREFWGASREPEKFLVPDTLIWGSERVLVELGRVGLSHSLLWLIQRQMKDHHVVVVTLDPSPHEIDVSFRKIGPGDTLRDRIAFVAIRRDIFSNCVNDPNQDWLRSLLSSDVGPIAVEITLHAPIKRASNLVLLRSCVTAIETAIIGLQHSAYRNAIDIRWNWRAPIFPPRRDYPALLEKYLNTQTLLPRSVAPKKADIGFVVPFGSFGGSEKVGYAAAAELRRLGFNTHLFIIGGRSYKIIPEFADAFDTINLVGAEVPSLWGGSTAGRGTEFGTADDAHLKVPLLKGLLATMDVVVNCQSAPLNAVMGDLRRLGIMTVSYLHLFDRSLLGRDVGHPFLGLLFEHAYDLFLLCSHALRHELHALGIPAEKLMTVDNAPGFQIGTQQIAQARAVRKTPGKTLRVLFIGRMDLQKGLERIVKIVETCTLANLDIEFRFIGSTIVENDIPARTLQALKRARIAFEAPIFSAEELAAAYREADVLILPSRWEGAPLVILEAQQCGCIPVASDVGAVAELIENDVDGIIVPGTSDQDVSTGFVMALARLQKELPRRKQMALAAMERASHRSWTSSFRAFADLLEARFAQGKDQEG